MPYGFRRTTSGFAVLFVDNHCKLYLHCLKSRNGVWWDFITRLSIRSIIRVPVFFFLQLISFYSSHNLWVLKIGYILRPMFEIGRTKSSAFMQNSSFNCRVYIIALWYFISKCLTVRKSENMICNFQSKCQIWIII